MLQRELTVFRWSIQFLCRTLHVQKHSVYSIIWASLVAELLAPHSRLVVTLVIIHRPFTQQTPGSPTLKPSKVLGNDTARERLSLIVRLSEWYYLSDVFINNWCRILLQASSFDDIGRLRSGLVVWGLIQAQGLRQIKSIGAVVFSNKLHPFYELLSRNFRREHSFKCDGGAEMLETLL